MDHRPARASDLPEIAVLLRGAALPVEGVHDHLEGFVVGEVEGSVVGVAGLETAGRFGLLRSVAVAPTHRRKGHARALSEGLIRRARSMGFRSIYLLTTDADDYFETLGFERVSRDAAPNEIRQHAQFTELCPDSAVLMCLGL